MDPGAASSWDRGGEAQARLSVLFLGFERSLDPILRYLGGFANLELAGRNVRFEYGWIHGMLRGGKDLVASCVEGAAGSRPGVVPA